MHGQSLWDYVPVIGTIRSGMRQPGEALADYALVPIPTCAECRVSPLLAEGTCRRMIDQLAIGYQGQLVAPGVGKFGVDAIVTALGFLSGIGTPISVVAGADGVIGAALTIRTAYNISAAATEAKKWCSCFRGRNPEEGANRGEE
jgi:hypothetical protein